MPQQPGSWEYQREYQGMGGKLTEEAVRQLPAGFHADNENNLYADIRKPSASFPGYWVHRHRPPGSRRQKKVNLGKIGVTTLRQARAKARALEVKRDAKIDIVAERIEQRAAQAREKTFDAVRDEYYATWSPSWRSAKMRTAWLNSLKRSASPIIGDLPIASITTPLIREVLAPIWSTTPNQAKDIQERIEAVFGYASAAGYVPVGYNPAKWEGHLAKLFLAPGKVKKRKHHASLPWDDIALFMRHLRTREGTAARALELLILDARRSNEILGATFDEIDLKTGLWIIPAERVDNSASNGMKTSVEHRSQLSKQALAIVQNQRRITNGRFVFPGHDGEHLGVTAFTDLLRRIKGEYKRRDKIELDVTAHGFRTTFSTWAREHRYRRELSEGQLAHGIDLSDAERAYLHKHGRPLDLLDERGPMVQAWADFCDRTEPAASSDNVATLSLPS
jgi:integrase